MVSLKATLIVVLVPLLLSVLKATSTTTITTTEEENDEDLSFLEEAEPPKDYPYYADPNYIPPEGEYEDFQQPPPLPNVDDKDVVVLNETNFDDFISKTEHVMVEFYAPWCGYCKQLAPEYAAAATELKEGGSNVVLAKVDAIKESQLADKYNVDGFPTLFFFSNGVHRSYQGERTKDGMVSWLKKKTGPAVYNITTTKEAEDILVAEPKLVVAYLDSLEGKDTEVLDAVAKQEDDVNFYQTNSPQVAQIFQIDSNAKRPVLVLLKKEFQKLAIFDGDFSESAIVDFVSRNKNPLIVNFTMESASYVFENPIQKQLFLFSTNQQSENLIPSLQDTAKSFRGKILFSYVRMDNEEYGKPMMDFFGVIGDVPRVLAYSGNNDRRKFFMEGDITSDNVKSFVEEFLSDNLKPFYKSDPLPEKNDGDVKIVVGKSFEEIVLDESKDVLLKIYAPWCSHCKALEPTYNRLARYVKGIDSLVIAKMDGTKNEHQKAPAQGFPTILFYPAGSKSIDPIVFDSDPTGVSLYKFVKKHATIPFTIQKPLSQKSEGGEPTTNVTVAPTISSHDEKDEL